MDISPETTQVHGATRCRITSRYEPNRVIHLALVVLNNVIKQLRLLALYSNYVLAH